MSSGEANDFTYDIIGLGFGPANLAIAAALVEKWRSIDLKRTDGIPIRSALFIEKHDEFRWHPGMLLPDARMQISFMKDLATLRNPQSPLTFISYLHSQNRLLAFINRGGIIPTRKEYADYLSWAAEYVIKEGISVKYGEEVIAIHKGKDGTLDIYSKNLKDGREVIRRTRNLIISPGGSPHLPRTISSLLPHPLVIHSATYASSIGPLLAKLDVHSLQRPLRIAVVGCGQSAAEVLLDLRDRLNFMSTDYKMKHVVEMIIRNGSLKPSNDSPFANEIFDPVATDMMYNLPSNYAREKVLDEYKSSNYGVVNPRTLDSLYEVMYNQKLEAGIAYRTSREDPTLRSCINILSYSSIISVEGYPRSGSITTTENPGSGNNDPNFRIIFRHMLTHEVSEKTYDAIICATGYERSSWIDLLISSNVAKHYGLQTYLGETQLTTTREQAIQASENLESIGEPTFMTVNENSKESESISTTPSSTSCVSTPPTSPGPSDFSSRLATDARRNKLFISRNYKILPNPSESTKGTESCTDSHHAGIYLQGCTEATHGLSETLLSVLGVRAGNVVDDLWATK